MTKYGIWTQQGQVLCPECASHVGKGMQMQMTYSIGFAYCDHCHKMIHAEESISREQHLVYAARQAGYADTYLVQTGGMCHACEITFKDFSDKQWCCSCTMQINPSDPGDYYWYTELYDDKYELVSERTATSEEEILNNIYWMQRNCCAIPNTNVEAEAGCDSSK